MPVTVEAICSTAGATALAVNMLDKVLLHGWKEGLKSHSPLLQMAVPADLKDLVQGSPFSVEFFRHV